MKTGYCVTCNQSFTLEVRVAGKLLSLGATALLGTTRKLPWWGTLLVGVGSVVLAHVIDDVWTRACPNPGCKTLLQVVDVAL